MSKEQWPSRWSDVANASDEDLEKWLKSFQSETEKENNLARFYLDAFLKFHLTEYFQRKYSKLKQAFFEIKLSEVISEALERAFTSVICDFQILTEVSDKNQGLLKNRLLKRINWSCGLHKKVTAIIKLQNPLSLDAPLGDENQSTLNDFISGDILIKNLSDLENNPWPSEILKSDVAAKIKIAIQKEPIRKRLSEKFYKGNPNLNALKTTELLLVRRFWSSGRNKSPRASEDKNIKVAPLAKVFDVTHYTFEKKWKPEYLSFMADLLFELYEQGEFDYD